MESYTFLAVIAIILISTKVLGVLSNKVHMPQVVGALLAGIILGPSCLGLIEETDFLAHTAEIGVIMLMFIAGLDTDIKDIKKVGGAALIIAACGVILPLLGGSIFYYFYFDNAATDQIHMLKSLFIGVVLMATSVSITVETLRELGRLKGKMGTAILGAAVIDDIIGIIALTVLTGFVDAQVQIGITMLHIGAYFIFIAAVALVVFFLVRHFPPNDTKRRTAIYGFSFCLILSFITEHFFGIADITGAYFAGLILCNMRAKMFIAKKMTVASYMFFGPIFFASIGLKTSLSGFGQILPFTLILLIIALLSKMIGCGLGAKLCHFNRQESLAIGIGMISRGEVALIVAQKGMQVGLIDTSILPAIVLMVIVTTIVSPILLEMSLRNRNAVIPPAAA